MKRHALVLALIAMILFVCGYDAQAAKAERFVQYRGNSITATSTYVFLVDVGGVGMDITQVDLVASCTGEFEINIGVITETDADQGTAAYFYSQAYHTAEWTRYTDTFAPDVGSAVIGSATSRVPVFATNHTKTNNEFQNDGGDLTPIGSSSTTKSWAHGDIVLVIEELTAGELDLIVRLRYKEPLP